MPAQESMLPWEERVSRLRDPNYSKWDAVGDSEDEEEARPKARVTRIEGGSKVNIGANGWSVEEQQTSKKVAPKKKSGIDYSRWDTLDESDGEGDANMYYEDEWHEKCEDELKEEAALRPPRQEKPRPPKVEEQEEERVGRSRDGETCFLWSQTASEVVARFIVDSTTKAADVKVSLTFQRDDDDLRGKCVLSLRTPTTSFEDALMHDVWCQGDDRPTFNLVENETVANELRELDWELVDSSSKKAVKVLMQKREPCGGLVAWWPRLFARGSCFLEEDLDTTTLGSRSKRSTPKAAKAFQTTWQEAHQAFQDKVKKIEPEIIDIGGDSD